MPNLIPANLRALAKRPAFTLAATSIVAIGIALTITVSSVVDALIYRPIPVPQVEQLHRVNGNAFNGVLPAPEARDIIERTDPIAFSYDHRFSVEFTLEKNAGLLLLCELQGLAFETLQWTAQEGRLLQADDYLPGSDPVTVISHSFWQNELAASPNVLGQALILNGKPFKIVGILPPELNRINRTIKPHAYTALIHTFDNWIYDNRGLYGQTLVARLDSPQELTAYQTQLNQAIEYLKEANPDSNQQRTLTALPETHAAREEAAEAETQSYIIVGLVSALLLITCFNVGNMLLSNAYRREREFAIRRSVGAAPLQIVRQLFAESATICVIGGLSGTILSIWLVQFADNLPFTKYVDVHINGPTLAVALAATLCTALLSGLFPSWHFARGDSAETLKQGGRTSRVTPSAKLLVVAQVALSTTLLCVAFLYTLSLKKSLEFDPGFDTERLSYFEVSFQSIGDDRRQQAAQTLRARLANLPGVESVGFSTTRPFRGYGTSHINTDRFKANEEADNCASGYCYVSPEFYDTIGVPILSGRDVLESESVWPFEVAMVNEAFEKRFFPDSSAIDQTFKPWGGEEQPPVRIVGVFRDYAHRPWSTPGPFFALTQASKRVNFHVRSEGHPRSILKTLESVLRDPANEFVAQEIRYFSDAQKESLSNERSALIVLGILAMTALLLSSVGIWYTTRQLVRQSQREFSIRMALGAAPTSLLALSLRRSLTLSGIGLALGTLISFVAIYWIQSSLNGVSHFNLLPYLATLAALGSVSFLSSYLPARSALKASPREALVEV
ncbi:FtsX-like permease family protein [Pelagicoccus mobilis]|uniref:ABC transporter permease n=1 Tax=Pelagicoccus mobilis TaxID=415221 RepID=A0A934VLQ8_9BACT|nr:FtsX-like permease family protein [Pelagicoccus mobilis]MBK1878016.1 ABC transporter permease [Pelagicoccus mobilis]